MRVESIFMAAFVDLPVELLLHIASNYSPVDPERPRNRFLSDGIDVGCILLHVPSQLELHSLRSLSQTSRALRQVFLPLAWERFDPSLGLTRSNASQVAKKLERQCEGLLKSPMLAAHVRYAAYLHFHCIHSFSSLVSLTRIARICIPGNTNPKHLIPCLRSLPNLHTLRLCLHGARSHALYNAFSFRTVRFPQVDVFVVTACDARAFIPCFPKVKGVIAASGRKVCVDLRGLFDESGDTLEELDGFALDEENVNCMI